MNDDHDWWCMQEHIMNTFCYLLSVSWWFIRLMRATSISWHRWNRFYTFKSCMFLHPGLHYSRFFINSVWSRSWHKSRYSEKESPPGMVVTFVWSGRPQGHLVLDAFPSLSRGKIVTSSQPRFPKCFLQSLLDFLVPTLADGTLKTC